MLVLDASALFEVLADTETAEELRQIIGRGSVAAPHLIDAEVLSVIQTMLRRGKLDPTAAHQAVQDLTDWPGERWSHRPLLARAWELRDNVRGYDALYVSLAEALDAPLLTLDHRLGKATGPRCDIVLPGEVEGTV